MLADAARRYCRQYGVKVGERVVVATAHDSAYRAALDLKQAGVDVALIADLRRGRERAAAARPRARPASRSRPGAEIAGVDGRLRVKAGARRASAARERTVACDALLMSGGWTPSVHLFSQSRGKLVFDEARQVFMPGASAQRERSAGACNATFDLAGALAEGDAAGRAAAAAAGFAAPERAGLRRERRRCDDERRRRAAASRRPPRQGLRRFPERRLRQGREPRGAGGHALDRAHQALHHDRHGDRPGQDLEHERARDRRRGAGEAHPGGRPDDLPPALYAGHLRRVRRPCARRPVRSDPPHADSRLGGRERRQVRGRRRFGSAPGIFPAAANRCTTRSRASAARPGTASACSTPRRSARSRSSAPMRRSSSSACTPMRSRSSKSAAAATASC